MADGLVAFWAANGGPTAEQAVARLPDVVCVLRGEDGAIAGACSVFAADVPAVNRRFWVFRALLPGDAEERRRDMIRETYAALAGEFDRAPGSPIGLCVLLGERERARWPEAEWRDGPLRMIYAGYVADRRQIRLAYFPAAAVGPGVVQDYQAPPLGEGYRIVPFAEQSAVTAEDVVELWQRETVLPAEEARRRVAELHLIGVDAADRPVGVSTAYLQHNEQLGMTLWYYRAFVADAHRHSALAVWLAVRGRELLERRFVEGEDTRAPGVVYEVENEGLKRYFPQAHWMPTDFLFIGDNARGDHVRVHWFAGAVAPEPPQGSA